MEKEIKTTETKKAKKAPKVVEPKSVSMVAYTDGSGRNVICSYGFHYYIYNQNDIINGAKSKPVFGSSKAEVTNMGLLTQIEKSENAAKFANAIRVAPMHYFTGRSNKKDTTNNYMEMLSIYKALEHFYNFCMENKYIMVSCLVKTDSMVSIQRIDNIMKDDPREIPLREEFKDMMNKFKEANCKVGVQHVYGHGSSVGNHLADRLAYSCGERSDEFEEVKDLSKLWNKSMQVGLFDLGNKVHIVGNEPATILVDKYKPIESIGERKAGRLVGLILPEELPEPYKSLYERYQEVGDDQVIDVKIDTKELKNKESSFLIHACGKDAIGISRNNKRWLKVCDTNTAIVGGNLGGLGVMLHTKLSDYLRRVEENALVCSIDIKEDFLKLCKKTSAFVKIPVKLDKHIKDGKLGEISVDSEITKKLKELKELTIFPSVDVPQATFILNILNLDEEAEFKLVIEDVNEARLTFYIYLKSPLHKFRSVWCDNDVEMVFFK